MSKPVRRFYAVGSLDLPPLRARPSEDELVREEPVRREALWNARTAAGSEAASGRGRVPWGLPGVFAAPCGVRGWRPLLTPLPSAFRCLPGPASLKGGAQRGRAVRRLPPWWLGPRLPEPAPDHGL